MNGSDLHIQVYLNISISKSRDNDWELGTSDDDRRCQRSIAPLKVSIETSITGLGY